MRSFILFFNDFINDIWLQWNIKVILVYVLNFMHVKFIYN